MSGGVDSSVAAALLKEEGYEVGGATIRTWAANDCENLNTRSCCGLSGVEDAREVAETLEIPYWVFNFEKHFKTHVVDYFADEYMKGRTPNPCIACNQHIKFRLFLERARQLGYDAIATGHYAQVLFDESRSSYCIAEGVDPTKDQSYVLFPLPKDVLQHLYLPVGGYSKKQIREKAKALRLCVMDKPDSQEICFIPSNNYGAFLEREYLGKSESPQEGESGTEMRGVIRTRDGTVLGQHDGYFHYTRGQRRGLKVAHSERLYVLETNPETNEVIVGTKEEVQNVICSVENINWFLKPEESSFRAHVKIRSQHQKAMATVTMLENQSVQVEFDEPQDAITSGQGAAFYRDTCVLGGGWIQRILQ